MGSILIEVKTVAFTPALIKADLSARLLMIVASMPI